MVLSAKPALVLPHPDGTVDVLPFVIVMAEAGWHNRDGDNDGE